MELTLQIPDELAEPLHAAAGDLSRRALEGFALEEFKKHNISKAQLRHMLGFETRYELDGFLKAHDVWVDATIEDVHHDMADLASFLDRKNQQRPLPRSLDS